MRRNHRFVIGHLGLILVVFAICPAHSFAQNGLKTGNYLFFVDTSTAVTIKCYLRSDLAPYAGNIISETRLIAGLYHNWFGPWQFSELVIVDTALVKEGTFSAQHLVIIRQKPVPFTRLFERSLASEIARLWFDSERTQEPFLVDGLAAYAVTRYLEAVYGEDNLLDLPAQIPFISGVSDFYLHQVYYYAAAVNNLAGVLDEFSEKSVDRFAFDWVYKSQAVLIMKTLEIELGREVIDAGIRHYRQANQNIAAFLACLSAAAGPEKEVIINRLFRQDGRNDLRINRVFRQGENVIINLSARSALNLPIEVKTVFAGNSFRVDTVNLGKKAQVIFATNKRVKQVILDPEHKVLEPDRWNNIYPCQVRVKPIFALPDFQAYQIFYGPWFWYDNYRGFQPGVWFQGRRFIDAGPVRGEHNWTLLHNYASKKSDWHTGISYQTPLLFYPTRLRLYIGADNSFRDRGIKTYLTSEIGNPFRLPKNEIQFGYRLYELIDTTGRDSRAWNKARTAEIRARFFRNQKYDFLWFRHELIFAQGLKPLLSEYNYSKISLGEDVTFSLCKLFSFSLRLFAGAIKGLVPRQERFYLSGGLSYTNTEPVSWAYEGMASGQEHWHYDGDANCRGYYGLYRSGRFAYGINIHLIPPANLRFPLSALQPFFDLGNVADSLSQPEFRKPVLDAGIRLKLGPLYADFPIWKSAPEPGEKHFAFRWSLGFKLTELHQ